MTLDKKIQGLVLKIGPLGEHDRLATILSDQEGLTRLAVPGARRPKSRLAAATPLTYLDLFVNAPKGLARVKHLNVLHSFNGVGQKLETLAAAQALAELCLSLVTVNDPIPGLLSTVLMHLERLEAFGKGKESDQCLIIASVTQGCIHLFSLGGYAMPLKKCCRSGDFLNPPLGDWTWECSLIPNEGFAIGAHENSAFRLNPSELALLQRLVRAELPMGKNGRLMGPKHVWLRLLGVVECWIQSHLSTEIRSLAMLREAIIN